jgi:hypothetical protein
MSDPDSTGHGSPEMLFEEIAGTAAGAAFHAQQVANYASVGNYAGTAYGLRCLLACVKAAIANARELYERRAREEKGETP